MSCGVLRADKMLPKNVGTKSRVFTASLPIPLSDRSPWIDYTKLLLVKLAFSVGVCIGWKFVNFLNYTLRQTYFNFPQFCQYLSDYWPYKKTNVL